MKRKQGVNIVFRGVLWPKFDTLQIGLGTELGTFKGTYRIASVLPSTDSY